MKLGDLKKAAKSGINPASPSSQCGFEGCEREATDRDQHGAWCWHHRLSGARDVLRSIERASLRYGERQEREREQVPTSRALASAAAVARVIVATGMSVKEFDDAARKAFKGGAYSLPNRASITVIDDVGEDKPMAPGYRRKITQWWKEVWSKK